MLTPSQSTLLRLSAVAIVAFVASLASVSAQAQTTIVLSAPGTEVTDTMVQGGASADKNFNASDMMATRASTNADYLRRALIKFDTQNTLPAGTQVQSAVLTLTIKSAGTDSQRTIGTFPVTTSFVQEEATW